MRVLIAVVITIITSLFFFPFVTPLLPGINTKLVLAVIGLFLLIQQGAFVRQTRFRSELVVLSLWAFLVSFVSFVTAVINNTQDYTYATYIISMWVWLAGAYTVIRTIDAAYGKTTFKILANFLIAVCVAQCILSQLIQLYPAVSDFVDRIMISEGFMGKNETRLYGLGCALDVAGLRFSAVLIVISQMCLSAKDNKYLRAYYLAAFVIITILGSMMSRTTSLGAVLAIVYLICCGVFKTKVNEMATRENIRGLWKSIFRMAIIVLPIVIFIYNADAGFRKDIRFGFEGFFSLFEQGEWVVQSNEQLLSMWYWPDNLRTWIIGDGYFDSPNDDMSYLGELYEGYYMGTDVGYCRFIFYFGLIGLFIFSCLFVKSALICIKNMPRYTYVFVFILIVNFIGWTKVSTDIFPIFALYLMLGTDEEEDNLENAQLKLS